MALPGNNPALSCHPHRTLYHYHYHIVPDNVLPIVFAQPNTLAHPALRHLTTRWHVNICGLNHLKGKESSNAKSWGRSGAETCEVEAGLAPA